MQAASLMDMVLSLPIPVERGPSLPVPLAAPPGGPAGPQISAPAELVETGHDLDCDIARDGGERDGNAFVRHSRRCALEREGEALRAGWSAVDRLRHRQCPNRRPSFGEQGGASSRGGCDVRNG